MSLTPQAKVLFKLMLLGFFCWSIGLLIFITKIPDNTFSIDKSNTDAVIILTGGFMRIEEGLSAFTNLNAKKVLVSGAGEGVTKKDVLKIAHSMGLGDKINNEQLVIGSIAFDTLSNAAETKIFMELNGYNSLRLVTSNYHILRSNYIFSYLMPELRIINHPVFSEYFRKNRYYISYESFKMIIREYNKFLGTYAIVMRNLYEHTIVKVSEVF